MVVAPRIILTAHDGTALGDIDPTKLIAATVTSEVNGENAMTLTTTQELSKGDRLLWRDTMGYWHEYVIESDEATHDTTGAPIHVYYAPWSIQHDLAATFVTGMPGTGGTPATARAALEAALAGTARWTVGTVGMSTTGSASFWRLSGWEAMQELVKVWGGEVRATITVSPTAGVTARKVDLLAHVGSATANRRFDYGGDATAITRTVMDEQWTASVMPLGAAEETDEGGYGRKITIESVNGGSAVLTNASAVPLTRVPNGNGGWEVPVQVVENSDAETPADLLAWAQTHLEEWTTPKVSYEATIAQLERAGLDAHGVTLGDQVVVVDRTFTGGGLRIEGRVLRIDDDLLDPTQTTLTISNLQGTLADQLASISRRTDTVYEMIEGMSASQASQEWVQNLLARINADINATGGYTYITEGQGIRTYDVAVTDPEEGDEASAVVEIKGGTIRIANSRDTQGQWQWKTVFTSGHILSELIEAIGSSSGYHAQLTVNGLDIYDGATLLAHFGEQIVFYDDEGGVISSFAGNAIEFWGGLGQLYANGNSVFLTGRAVSVEGSKVSTVDGTTSTASVGTGIVNQVAHVSLWAMAQDFASYVGMHLAPAGYYGYTYPTIQLTNNADGYTFAMLDFVNSIPVTLYNNEDASASASATLSETAANFRRMTILYKDTDNTCGSVEVWSPNGKRVALSLTWINGTSTQGMYQRVRWVTISGTSIATSHNSGDAKYRTGQVQLGATASVTNSDYISITRVIGYR